MLHANAVEAAEEEIRQLTCGPGSDVHPVSFDDVAWFAGKSLIFLGDPEQLLAVSQGDSPTEIAQSQVFTRPWLTGGFRTIELKQSMRASDPQEEGLRSLIKDISQARDGDDLSPESLEFLRQTVIPAESLEEQTLKAVRLALETENAMLICYTLARCD